MLECATSGIVKGRTIDILSSDSLFALRPILGAGKGSSLVPEEREREREREREEEGLNKLVKYAVGVTTVLLLQFPT